MRTRKGFTIVELVVVIAVIAILAAVLIPSFSGVVEKTDRSTALKLAEAAYKEARALALEDNNVITQNEEVVAGGFKFRFDANGASATVVLYPSTFKYYISAITADEIELGDKRTDALQPDSNITPIDGQSIQLYISTLEMEKGQREVLYASVSPANATNYSIEWSSNAPSVATVNRVSGLVVAEGEGSATVTATLKVNDEPKHSASCTVTVKPVSVNFVSLNSLNLSFTMGDVGRQLTATVKPDNAANKTVTWQSSNSNVATVDNGLVNPVGPGYTEITATANNITAKCGVTVNGLALGVSEADIKVGEMLPINATAYPVGTIAWSSNDGCVSVNQYGVVTAHSTGTATVTAEINGFKKTCTINVEEAISSGETPETPNPSIALNKTAISIAKDKVFKLELTKTNCPAETTVVWTTDKDEVATVADDGTVTAVGVGGAKINVTAKNGDTILATATCVIEVVESSAIESIALDKTTATIIQGDTVTLVPTVVVVGGETYAISWESNPASVATVDANGVVTGAGNGTATITATVGGHSVSCEITVRGKYSVTVNATTEHIAFGGDSGVIHGDTYTAILASNENCAIQSISVTMGGTSVSHTYENKKLTVSDVTGDLVITVTTIQLTPTLAESVTLNKNTLELGHGESETLTATVLPAGADQSLTWHSSNTNVASVDANGKITAHNAGSATITVFTSNGKTATCEVTVTGTPVTGVTLNRSELTLAVGGSETLIATVKPDDATNKNVTWKSNKTGIAIVDENGKVTGISAGTTTIVVITEDGTYIDVCTVTVTASGDVGGGAGSGDVAVTGVTLSENTMTVGVGLTKNLEATVSPDNATNKNVTWTSSDESIATVDPNGKVTGVAIGTTTITAKTGDYSASCTVTVKQTYDVRFADGNGANVRIVSSSKAVEGDEYALQLVADEGFIISTVTIKANGGAHTGAESNERVYEDSIQEVHSDIVIEVTALGYADWKSPFAFEPGEHGIVLGYDRVTENPLTAFYIKIKEAVPSITKVEVHLLEEDPSSGVTATVKSCEQQLDPLDYLVVLDKQHTAKYICVKIVFVNPTNTNTNNFSIVIAG